MKDVILDYYEITPSTMALLSVANTNYCTIALERNRQLYIRKTPAKLVKEACLEGGSTYEGRRVAVCYHIGFKQKVPIPINPREQIFAFPTQSPDAFDCSWIFYNHVKSIKTDHSSNKHTTQSILTFKNDQQITLNESNYILEKQMQRTAICILYFSPKNHYSTS